MRKMIWMFVVMMMSGSVLEAQAVPHYWPTAPAWEVAGGYSYLRANAPPGRCGCFNMQGGFVAGEYGAFRDVLRGSRMGISLLGEYAFGSASDISALGQNLDLSVFAAGPKVAWRRERVRPFAQMLFGVAHGANSYFPSGATFRTSASSFAWEPGAGVDVALTRRFAVRAVEAEFLHTALPNGTTDAQHQLRIQAGVVVRLGRVE